MIQDRSVVHHDRTCTAPVKINFAYKSASGLTTNFGTYKCLYEARLLLSERMDGKEEVNNSLHFQLLQDGTQHTKCTRTTHTGAACVCMHVKLVYVCM